MSTWELDAPDRLRALGEVDAYPGVPDEAFAVYTRLITKLLGAPTALVSFVTEDRQFFPASVGLGEPWNTRGETPLAMSFCQHVVRSDAALVVTHADVDARVEDNLGIEELGVHAYLGVPLRAPGGEPLGALCAIDSEPRQWTDSDVAVMLDLAEAVGDTIALRVSEHRRAELAAGASHELRTPLARLRFELDDLAHQVLDVAEASDGVAAAVRQVEELAAVVDDLMSMAQAGPLRDAEVELLSLCREAAVRHASLPGGAAGTVAVQGEPVHVRASPTVLRRVVDLLLASVADAVAVDVRGDGEVARVAIRGQIASAPGELEAAGRLSKSVGARLLTRPAGDIAYELIIPQR